MLFDPFGKLFGTLPVNERSDLPELLDHVYDVQSVDRVGKEIVRVPGQVRISVGHDLDDVVAVRIEATLAGLTPCDGEGVLLGREVGSAAAVAPSLHKRPGKA